MERVPKVRAWSNTVRKGSFHPGDVDLFVLRDHQPILRALGRERADEGEAAKASETPRRRGFRQLSCLAPVFTVVLLGGSAPRNLGADVGTADAEWAVPVLALLWLVAAPGPFLLLRRWWLSDRRRDPLELVYFVLVLVLGGGIALRGLATIWDTGVGSVLASLPVWVTVVAAAVGLVATGLGSHGTRTQGDLSFRRIGDPDAAKARQMIEALPARMREQLHDMRTRAVENLRKRGVVDADEARRITSTPLGEGPLARS